jgi:uncharacterized membrane protein
MEIFSMEGWYFLLRWFHFLAGITWIGVLYYFNFIQTPFFGSELGGSARSAMVRGLVPNALWWFRWGAMFTMGTLMWANVWFVIWPAQQVVIANAEKVAGGGEADPSAAGRGARAGVASRTNTLFSIPMLFFMGAASHFTSLGGGGAVVGYWIAAIVVIGLVELNCLVGSGTATQKPLGSVSGTIHAGLGLTVVLYLLMSLTL